jgi:hypothetical protein
MAAAPDQATPRIVRWPGETASFVWGLMTSERTACNVTGWCVCDLSSGQW